MSESEHSGYSIHTVLRMIMIGKTADMTVVQRTLTDTLYEQGKPQKVTDERQRAVSKHLHLENLHSQNLK